MRLIIQGEVGSVELPLCFDWYARLVELYGLFDATRFALFVARYDLFDFTYQVNFNSDNMKIEDWDFNFY